MTVPEMEIVPYERFGPVPFGATEEEVVEIIGPPMTARSKPSGGRLLIYRGMLGFHVSLDRAGRCRLVQSTLRISVPVVDGDLRLVGSLDDVVRALHERGFETRQGPDPSQSYETYCDALGIVLWREDEDQEDIDSVAALRRDYYVARTRKDA